ncbi:MAG: tetratricopeptide repeat protein [Candidatus Eisenbacteria bacterium]|nr:tetratricopeptide repeat protein [Candidatus Eisenbacteria bacterium]
MMARGTIAVAALALIAAALIAYAPALRGGFIWDDDSYVTANPHLRSAAGLRAIWLQPGATTQYYPLVHTAFWIEHRLWGLRPFGYHLINVLLHGVGAALLFLALRRLGVPGAWFAAAIWALHPVQVESAAWITERKNVLSGALYFGAALAWFARRERIERTGRGGRGLYALSFILFVGALLAKTVTASLPAALLLAAWWRRGRIDRREASSLLPFFAVGAAAGLFTAWIESDLLGARGAEWSLTLLQRTALAGRALFFYLGKLAWPARLSFIYPRVVPDGGAASLFPAAAALGIVVALLLLRRRIGRGAAAAALFFGGTLLPALGFFDVYPFRFSFTADHFQYLASAGPIVLFAAGCARLGRWVGGGERARTGAGVGAAARTAPLFAAALLLLLGGLAWRQAGAYRDLETLWRDTLEKNPGAWMAHVNLGEMLAARGDGAEAAVHFQEALRLDPENDKAHNNLGNLLAAAGRREEAIRHYREAIRIEPRSVSARSNLGLALLDEGRPEEAIEQFIEALRLRPGAPEPATNLGVALLRAGRPEEAERAFREALRARPNDAGAHYRLGVALAAMGRPAEAEAAFRESLRFDPNHPGARRALGE